MATEILRPNEDSAATTSCNIYPSDVELGNFFTLINEVTADDDSTYIESASSLAHIKCAFDSELLRNNYPQIASVRVICRIQADPASSNMKCFLDKKSSSGSTTDIATQTIIPSSSDWETVYVSFEKADVITAVTSTMEEDERNSPLWFRIIVNQADSAVSKDTLSLKVSQVYVEITYEDDGTDITTETIYLKENGTWTSVPCTIYQKQNGAWVETDSSIFTNGDKFNLQEIT